MRLLEAVPALFILALAAFIFFGTAGASYWDGITPGSRFFPAVLALAGVIVALALIWAQWRGLERIELDMPDAAGLRRVGLCLAGLVLLAIAAPKVGFVPTIAAFVLFILLGVLKQRPVPSIATAAFVAAFVELIFVRWLAVPLPAPFWT